MPAESLKCPQCGGGLDLKPAGQPVECGYCGSKLAVPANAARSMTSEEMQEKLQRTKAQMDAMIDTVAPGSKTMSKVITVIAIVFFITVFLGIVAFFLMFLGVSFRMFR